MRQCKRCDKETTNAELCEDCFAELFIPSEAEFANAFIMESEVGSADNERRKQDVRDYLNLHPKSTFNNSHYYPPQDIKKPMRVTCDRCNQEIKPVNGTYYVPCPCRKAELERLDRLHGDFEISIHEVLEDGTTVPYLHTPTDEELEAWRASDGRE